MPTMHEQFRGMVTARVNWNESDWTPEECHWCGTNFDSDYDEEIRPRYFYDVQRSNGVIVNEDHGYCSIICARSEISRMIDEGEAPNFSSNAEANDTQEEETTE